ncbi:MAG: T9SS type A sorting domain-containing protein [Bacteroidota bacterium]
MLVRHSKQGLVLVYFVLGWAVLFGQLSISSTVPAASSFGLCKDSVQFSFNIAATISSVAGVGIDIHMPPGISFVNSSLSNTGSGTHDVYFDTHSTNVLSLTGDDLSLNDSYDFSFAVTANCESLDALLAGMSFHDTINVAFNTNQLVQDSTAAFNNSLVYPQLSITQPSTPSGNLNDVVTRNVSINNSGSGCLTEFLWYDVFESDIRVDSVYFLGSKLSTYSNGDSIFYTFGSQEFAQIGDSTSDFCLADGPITALEFITIIGCNNNGSQLSTSWGCAGSVCEQYTTSGDVSLSGDQPNLTFNFPNPGLPDCFHEQANQEIMIMANNGAGTATGIEVEIKKFFYGGQFEAYKYDGLDTSTVELRYNSGSFSKVSVKNVEANIYYNSCSQPYIYRFTVDVPDMGPGDSVFIRFDMINCEPTECGEGSIKQGAWGYNYRYSTSCSGGTTILSNRQADQGASLSWVMSNYDNPTIPNQVEAILTSTVQTAEITYPGEGEYIVRFELPDCGLTYSGDSTDVFWKNISGDILWPQTSFTQDGDTLEAVFAASEQPVGFDLAGSEINLLVTGACNCVGTDTLKTLTKAIRYIPDPSCSSTAEIELYCEDVEYIVDLCSSASCDGIEIDAFDFLRTTYGLPDNDFNRQPESGSVDLNAIRTDRVRLGDTISASLRGIVAGTQSFQHGYAEITIDQGVYLRTGTGSFRMWDASASIYRSCDSLPVTKFGNDRFRFMFSPDSLSASCASLAGITFDGGDSIWVYPTFIVDSTSNQSLDIGKVYPIDLYLSHTASPSNANQASCGSAKYSAKFQIIPMVDNSTVTTSSAVSCQDVQAKTYFNLFTGGSYTDMFPSEYRSWSFPDTVYVVKPDSFSFQSAYLFLRFSPYSKSYTPTPIDVNADTLLFDLKSLVDAGTIIRPDDGYEMQFFSTWQPSCHSLDGGDVVIPVLTEFYWETGLESYDTVRNYSPIINHTSPALQINNTGSSTQDGLEDTVNWSIQLQNTSSTSDATYSWFTFSSPSGNISVSKLIDMDGGGGTVPSSNGIYQLGTISKSGDREYTIAATYNGCALDTLYVYAGWNCSGYPTNFDAYSCEIDTFLLRVDPKPSSAQITILSGPSSPATLCTDLSYEIQISSTQMANVENLILEVSHPSGGIQLVSGTAQLAYPLNSSYSTITDPDSISGGFRFTFSDYHSSLAANGLEGLGGSDANNRSLKVTFNFQTNCDFSSGDVMYLNLSGTRPCGGAVSAQKTTDAIQIVGVTAPYSTNINVTSDSIVGCNEGSSIRVSLYPIGGTTNGSDEIRVSIPQNFSYIGNFTDVHQAPSVSIPASSSLGALGTQLTWDMPGSIASGDSIIFQFDVSADSITGCSNYAKYISVATSFQASVSCGGSVCPDYFGSSGNSASYLTLDKPDLSINYLAHNSSISGANRLYTVQTILLNSGTDLSGNDSTTVEYYCDADSSGGLSSGDVYLGGFSDKIAINRNELYTFTHSITAPLASCDADKPLLGIIRSIPSNSVGPAQCLCDTFYVKQASDITLPIRWPFLSGISETSGIRLLWDFQTQEESEHFIVFRKESGVANWDQIGHVPIGTSTNLFRRFTYLDRNSRQNAVYRLAHMNANGDMQYSPSIQTNFGAQASIQIFPNPTEGITSIRSSHPLHYRLFDLWGRPLLEGDIPVDAPVLDIGHLPRGIYLLDVWNQDEFQQIKLIRK